MQQLISCLTPGLLVLLILTSWSSSRGQGENPEAAPQTIVIKREPLQLIDHREYQASLELEPIRSLTVKAPLAGTVRLIQVKTAQKVLPQTAAIQLDNSERQLELDRRKLELKAAKLELDAAKAANSAPATIQLHEAKVQIAEKEVELAELRLKQTVITVPFDAHVSRILVTPGEYVSEGEPLLTAYDQSQLKVELPMDRSKAVVGQNVSLKIEDQTAQGTIKAVYPLGTRFEKLRDLIGSAVAAEVVLDNAKDQWKLGQTVYPEIVPRSPVSEVPNLALQNLIGDHPEDHRKLQVIRDQLVRDLEVKVLAPVGAESSYVSGPFLAGDELILTSSQPLADGTQVRPTTASVSPVRPSATTPGTAPVQPTAKPGF